MTIQHSQSIDTIFMGDFEKIVSNNYESNLIVNIVKFDAQIDGITDDSKSIQNCINSLGSAGGTIISPLGTMVVNSSITVPDNITIDFSNTKIISTLTGSALPLQFFLIDGNNIDISVDIELTAPPNSPIVSPSFCGSAIIFNSPGTYDNVRIHNCKTRYSFYSVYGFDVTLTNCHIEDNDFVSIYRDIYLNKLQGSYLFIENNNFPITRNWSAPIGSYSQIELCAGFNLDGADVITDDIYLNHCFNHLYVRKNTIYQSNDRPIYVVNAVDVHIIDNSHEGVVGVNSTNGVSDDNFIVEFCRNFVISGNICNASGQNGIDILASKNGSVTGNSCMQCYADGIMFTFADCDVRGKAPALSASYKISSNINVIGNRFDASIACIEYQVGQNISTIGNTLSVNTIDTATATHLHLAVNPITAVQTFISANASLLIKNISMDKNTTDVSPSIMIITATITSPLVQWGTIELGRSLAIKVGPSALPVNTLVQLGHSKGQYNNVEVHLIPDATTYPNHPQTDIRVYGKWTYVNTADITLNKVHGTNIQMVDNASVYIESGDYLDDCKRYGYGNQYVGNITAGTSYVLMY